MIVGDEPVPGYYMRSLVRGGPRVPIRIWFGNPVIDDEEQDRAPRWLVEVNGKTDFVETGDDGYSCRVPLDVHKYWPWCGRYPITEAEYNYMLAKAGWAKQFAPERPQANPHKKIDVRGKSVF